MQHSQLSPAASNAIQQLLGAETALSTFFEAIQNQLADPRTAGDDDLLLHAGSALLRARMQIRDSLATARRFGFRRIQGGHAA
jgi:hypothetical protein